MDQQNNAAPNVCTGSCDCPHHYVLPISIILIGVAFLLNAFDIVSPYALSIAWPILLIVAASTKFCRCCGCCGK